MKQRYTPLKLMISATVVAAALALAGPSASAQTATTAATPTTKPKQPRATATPEMIEEAVQRSKARAAKARQSGTPEQFGSEEPFTFTPGRR